MPVPFLTLYTVGTVKPVTLDAGAVRTYVSVDGGMSDNIRTALYDADYSCTLASRTSEAPPVLTRVVGKHCEAGDIVVKDEFLPGDVAPGDLVAVPGTGAYCRSMASNYNYLLKPPVVAVRDAVATEIVRRQTLSDVFALDAVLADVPAPGLARVEEKPDAGVAKHIEYALTWFALAATVLAGCSGGPKITRTGPRSRCVFQMTAGTTVTIAGNFVMSTPRLTTVCSPMTICEATTIG
mgnify:CR=1 FL=1